jgi:hypothetical protein
LADRPTTSRWTPSTGRTLLSGQADPRSQEPRPTLRPQDTLAGVNRIPSQTSVQPSTLREPSPARAPKIQHRERIRPARPHVADDRVGDAAIAPVRCAWRRAGRSGLPARCAWAPALARLPLSGSRSFGARQNPRRECCWFVEAAVTAGLPGAPRCRPSERWLGQRPRACSSGEAAVSAPPRRPLLSRGSTSELPGPSAIKAQATEPRVPRNRGPRNAGGEGRVRK